MRRVTEFDWNLGALAEGLRCYRSEQFFLAHEHWESVWLSCKEPERSFLQALIQIAGAFHHFQRSNLRGATSLLNRALGHLQPYPAMYNGVAVSLLRKEVEAWLQALDVKDSPVRLLFPEIRIGN